MKTELNSTKVEEHVHYFLRLPRKVILPSTTQTTFLRIEELYNGFYRDVIIDF